MQSVALCRSCGKTVETTFIFCPWCGISIQHIENADSMIDTACKHLRAIQQKGRENRITKLEDSLQQLEEDLTVIIDIAKN